MYFNRLSYECVRGLGSVMEIMCGQAKPRERTER